MSLVHTGEVSGTLDTIMDQTAGYMERAETLRLKVQAALRYPMFVLTFACLMPDHDDLQDDPHVLGHLQRFQVPLPLPTQCPAGDRASTIVDNLLDRPAGPGGGRR